MLWYKNQVYEWELERIKILKVLAKEAFHLVLFGFYFLLKLMIGAAGAVFSAPQLVRQIEPGKFEKVERGVIHQNGPAQF